MKVLSIKDMFAALRLGIVPSVVCGVFSGLQLDNKVIGGEIAIMRSNQVIAQVAKALQVENVVAFNPHLQQRSWIGRCLRAKQQRHLLQSI